MYNIEQGQAGAYHVQDLRAQARRDADARLVAPRSRLRSLVRPALRGR